MKIKSDNSIAFLKYLLFFLVVMLSQTVKGEIPGRDRNILTKEATGIDLGKVLIYDNSWNKVPDYYDRNFWSGISPEIRQDYINRAEGFLGYDWPVVKATDYLEYIRSGDRRQGVYAACSNALISLVMGELVEGKGRFLDQIINGVWYYCEQTWWGWSAHLGSQKAGPGLPDINDPYVDLGVGEVTSNLSWTLYLFEKKFDEVHPLISGRLRQEIYRKVLDPYLSRDDFGYMGFTGGRPNNWNPWINYNMLTSYMLLEKEPQKRKKAVEKIINSLDKFLNGYPDDGGCDEGPSYWGAAGALLYECLEVLKNSTGGRFDVFDDQLIRNMGTYFPKVNIHAPYFINFADADARTGGSPSIVYRYGKAIGDPVMQKFGAYLAELGKWGTSAFNGKIGDQIKNLCLAEEIRHAEKEEALVADFWFPDTEVAGARDREGSFLGFFFGAKGGFNAESHNHNDVGSCLMYFDGKPCLIDLGREQYVAKTFGPDRYEIWTMQSGYHNLPVINGTEQKDGEQYRARNANFVAGRSSATFSADIAGAYPEAAHVKTWIRSYTLNRGKNFIISDRYELDELTDKITSSNLITCCRVEQVRPGLLKFTGDGFTLNMIYNTKTIRPVLEFREVTDHSLKNYWPDGVTRVKLEFLKPGLKSASRVIFTKAG